jgi:imidazolonepropionase-like amidohydrolase
MVYVPSPFARLTKEEWQKQRDEQLKALREAFANARAYMTARKAEQQKDSRHHDSDPRWEAMIPVLKGSIPVFVEANELSQIQGAITWAEQEGLRLVIVGGRDALFAKDQLKSKDIPVIVTDVQSAPARRWQGYDEVFSLPARLKQAGIRFCIAGDGSASNVRNVAFHAANAAAYGLPVEDALKSVTLHAAEILGIGDKVGSLEVGKDATLIVTTGDPLQPTTITERMFIQGKTIDLRDKHKQLYEKYKEKYRQMSERQ